MTGKAFVKNAASEKQVRDGELKENMKGTRKHEDWRFILNTPQGRRVIWQILEECKAFGSIWAPNASIHYNSGKQDLGHIIMGEIVSVDEEALFLMMRENKERLKGE